MTLSPFFFFFLAFLIILGVCKLSQTCLFYLEYYLVLFPWIGHFFLQQRCISSQRLDMPYWYTLSVFSKFGLPLFASDSGCWSVNARFGASSLLNVRFAIRSRSHGQPPQALPDEPFSRTAWESSMNMMMQTNAENLRIAMACHLQP